MEEDLRLVALSPNTRRTYLRCAAVFVRNHGKGMAQNTGYVDWDHLLVLLVRFPLPPPRLVHRYVTQRTPALTSRMRWSRTSGSVGAPGYRAGWSMALGAA